MKLSDLKVGDSVVMEFQKARQSQFRCKKIARKTKTQLTVDGVRFMQDGGSEVGGHRLYHIYVVTDRLLECVRISVHDDKVAAIKKRIGDLLGTTDDLEKLDAAAAALENEG